MRLLLALLACTILLDAALDFDQVNEPMSVANNLNHPTQMLRIIMSMIRKLKTGQFRLYSRKKNPETGKRRNLGTFSTLEQARQHEREVQYFKRH